MFRPLVPNLGTDPYVLSAGGSQTAPTNLDKESVLICVHLWFQN